MSSLGLDFDAYWILPPPFIGEWLGRREAKRIHGARDLTFADCGVGSAIPGTGKDAGEFARANTRLSKSMFARL